jgi:hypothetical protein
MRIGVLAVPLQNQDKTCEGRQEGTEHIISQTRFSCQKAANQQTSLCWQSGPGSRWCNSMILRCHVNNRNSMNLTSPAFQNR